MSTNLSMLVEEVLGRDPDGIPDVVVKCIPYLGLLPLQLPLCAPLAGSSTTGANSVEQHDDQHRQRPAHRD